MAKHVITISRELGSGGNQVAQELSKRLGIPYYDKEIINKTAQEFGVPHDQLQKNDEKKTNSFLFSLATAQISGATASVYPFNDIILDDRTFMYTSETIKRLAEEPCIIVGRCADYILQNRNIIKVFVCADESDRVIRISESLGLSEKNAQKLIQKTDKRRASYYNSYTDREWGRANNYHITVNTSMLGIDGSVDVLQKFIETYNKNCVK